MTNSKIIGHDINDIIGSDNGIKSPKDALRRLRYFFNFKRICWWINCKKNRISSLRYKIFHGIGVGNFIKNESVHPELGKSKYITIKRKGDILQFKKDGKEYRIIPSTSSLGFYFEEIDGGRVKSRNSFQIDRFNKNSNIERAN